MRIILMFMLLLPALLRGQFCCCQPESCFMAGSYDAPVATLFLSGNGVKLCAPSHLTYENDTKIYYDYLSISECDKNEGIYFGQGDLWGGLIPLYNTVLQKDTIYVTKYLNVPRPYGDTISQSMLWEINKVYFKNGILTTSGKLQHKQKPYTNIEIKAVLKQFEAGPKELKGDIKILFTRLFVTALSKNSKAKNYFMNFQQLYKTLDEDDLDIYKHLVTLYREWESTPQLTLKN